MDEKKTSVEDKELAELLQSDNMIERMSALIPNILDHIYEIYKNNGLEANRLDILALPFFLEEWCLFDFLGEKTLGTNAALELENRMVEIVKNRPSDANSFDLLWALARVGSDFTCCMDDTKNHDV